MNNNASKNHPAICSLVWPFQEALKVIQRLEKTNKTCAIFETGYGPSGLPHMGTVAEVVRTLMIKKAFDLLTKTEYQDKNYSSKLIAFVDDMDGFRKVPTNVPEQEMLAKHLNKPLTAVPDPFHQCNSFGEYNSKRFAHLLERLGCKEKIEIYSATEQYTKGHFNQALLDTLKYHKDILDLMLSTLREERQSTYSPFLPISPVTGCVLQVPMKAYNVDKGTIVFEAEDGKDYEIPVTDGTCKLQWKPDLGMRWHALGIDYELYGKDLISTAEIASKICKILGSNPPEGMHYELFLSPEGGRVSKSKGNESLTLDNWYLYTPKGCLEHFLFSNPQRAKRMRLEDLPTYVEQYLQDLIKYTTEIDLSDNSINNIKMYENPIFYIDNLAKNEDQSNKPLATNISYKLMLSLACATHIPTLEGFLNFVKIDANDTLGIDVASKAYLFYVNEVKTTLKIEKIPLEYKHLIEKLINSLEECIKTDNNQTASALQSCFFEIGKEFEATTGNSISQWFTMLYKAIIGAEQGPKLGSFCILYGTENIISLLKSSF